MENSDVLAGIDNLLYSDKREKYISYLRKLNGEEKIIIKSLCRYTPENIPAEIPLSVLYDQISDYGSNKGKYEAALISLFEQGILLPTKRKLACRFSDELFRIFMSLTNIEEEELAKLKIKLKLASELKTLSDSEIEARLARGDLTLFDRDTRNYVLKRLRDTIENLRYEWDWEPEDTDSLAYENYLNLTFQDRLEIENELDEFIVLPTDKEIVNAIYKNFDVAQFRDVCRELGINYRNLLDQELTHKKIRQIVSFCKKNGLIRDLVRICTEVYPNITWDAD
jgi:hypothetical protein